MEFRTRCATGRETVQVVSGEANAHGLLDRLRARAVGSTLVGGLAGGAAWIVVT